MSSRIFSTASQSSQPPRSPWLRKYGGEMRNVLNIAGDTVAHSGFAPLFPSLHPTYFAEESTVFEQLPPYPIPPGHELDMLFSTEASQIRLNGGLTTWEMGVLREHLAGGRLGGHRQMDPVTPYYLDAEPGVRVDEGGWHPVFAKSKWYDFRLPIVDRNLIREALPGINVSDVWSVDVPKLWTELRVSLELTNRWLFCMAEGPWLNHMVHEERVEWFEAEPSTAELEDPTCQLGPNRKPWRIPARSRNYDAEKTLKIIAKQLAPKLVWTFMDDGYHPYDAADNGDYYGRTIKHWNDGEAPDEDTPAGQRKPPFITIYIHVAPLRVLLDPKSTLAERSHARWSLAMTMLHELMHAINMTRHLDQIYPVDEPCYDQEWDRELGSSAVKSFFGGDILETPMIDTAGKSGYKYGMTMKEFPSLPAINPVASVNNKPLDAIGRVTDASPLPAAWYSSHLLESFYTTVVQKYGLAAFQAPRLFSAPNIFRGFYLEAHRAEPLANATSAEHAHLMPSIHATLADLQARRLAWNRLRPWYDHEHRLWKLTPYSNVAARAVVARFAAAAQPLRRLTEADELAAEREAHVAVSGMDYWLNCHLARDGIDARLPRRDWLFAVLALMMQAALPARRGAGYEHDSREVANTWFPSRAALARGEGAWRFAPTRTVWRELGRLYHLPDRHLKGHTEKDEHGEVVVYQSSRLWLLERALEIMQDREAVEPLPMALSMELERELQSLFQQDASEKTIEEWLDWSFKFPEYTGNLMKKNEYAVYVPWTGYPTVQGAPGPASGPSGHPGQGQAHAMAAQVGGRKKHGLGSLHAPAPTRYFTVSEVGEATLNDPTGTSHLALLPDDTGGYDVVDVGALPGFKAKVDTEPVFESTELGRVIVSRKLAKALQVNCRKPLGKLLTCKHPQEVFEHDGREGRALWCVIGNFVYDITAFPFNSEAEREALVALARGNKAPREALDGQDVSSLLSRLSPYKCGFLRQTKAAITASTRRTFTLRELGRYIYPQTGMYCAIDGYVYDLGRYLHSHPGGAQILYQYAGRDATDEFKHAHLDWQQTLMNHDGLKVGRVIGEIPQNRGIEESKIVLLNRVFDISKLRSEDPDFYSDLAPYAGADSTDALKAANAPHALVRLFSRGDLVCAKIVRGTKKSIAPPELRRHCRIPSADERRREPSADDADWRVWVAVPEVDGSEKHMVYDVTFMVMFGGPDLERKLRAWLGKEVRDTELAEMLRTRHQSFVIGELHGSGGRSEKASGARKGQVQSDKHGRRQGHGRRDVAGSKRRVGAVDTSNSEIISKPKRFRSR